MILFSIRSFREKDTQCENCMTMIPHSTASMKSLRQLVSEATRSHRRSGSGGGDLYPPHEERTEPKPLLTGEGYLRRCFRGADSASGVDGHDATISRGGTVWVVWKVTRKFLRCHSD
jgi:hypothetical protein